jgi:hypothetical protein
VDNMPVSRMLLTAGFSIRPALPIPGGWGRHPFLTWLRGREDTETPPVFCKGMKGGGGGGGGACFWEKEHHLSHALSSHVVTRGAWIWIMSHQHQSASHALYMWIICQKVG